jgi:pSer/pThr/pTyr-binding forkhead associated (FHA) protein
MTCLALLQARWVDTRHPGDTVPLTRPTISVGRGAGNDVVVEHVALSKRHLEIRLWQGGAAVRDLGSTNGTFFEGRRLPAGEAVPLPYGSALRLSNCLELRLLPARDDLPAGVTPPRLHFVRLPQPGLIIVPAGGPSRRVPLRQARSLLGRSSACDVVIDHPLVSRQHAEIVAQGPGQFYIRDLGSRNGLFWQGQRIDGKVLQAGEPLSIAPGPEGPGISIQFEPALGFLTEPGSGAPPEAAMTAMPAVDRPRLVTCPGCGAENFGPQTGCLRCHARLPRPRSA